MVISETFEEIQFKNSKVIKVFEIVFPVSYLFHQYVVSSGSDTFPWEYLCG